MLFNSYSFIFFFFPVTLFGFFWLARYGHNLAAAWLVAASLFFYGWWNPAYVGLLLGSIAFNYTFGAWITRISADDRPRFRKGLLTAAVTGNLLLLGYYKYANFFLQTVNGATGLHLDLGEIILPLGISFFTFTQIAFLVDAYRGEAKEYSFVHYSLFVTYFPHLIAGPVLHHKEMMPQFGKQATYRLDSQNVAAGLTIFAIGLFKKTVLADGVAPYADAIFSGAARGDAPGLLQAWGGVLAYSVQLYFDFSGYCDMAIGLSRMFGIQLPLNFYSPYKAINIVEFWRRWHMTLSRFLRDYVYFSLGGNRHGTARRYVNLGITMLLGGLWHGAGWTFVAWGALHGAYLMINHAWQALRSALGQDLSQSSSIGRAFGWSLTMLAVVVAWVFFRATSFESAILIAKGMSGQNGISLPIVMVEALGPLRAPFEWLGGQATPGGATQLILTYAWVLPLWLIAAIAPNTSQIVRNYQPALDYPPRGIEEPVPLKPGFLAWNPDRRWGFALGILGACGLLSLSRVSAFLYFQF